VRVDRQQQINNQPGGDTAVKSKAALVVNGEFCHHVDHGGSGKVGGNDRAAVDNRQQWQWKSGNNQCKVTVASGGVDSRGGGSGQRRSMAIGGETPMAKAIVVVLPTPLLLWSAGGGRQAAAAAAAARE
jgi:hypothetical protein